MPLDPGVEVVRSIGAGSSDEFSITLNAGDTIKLAVDQLGLDVAIEIADHATSADDEEKHHYGRELLVWSAPASGRVPIVVRAKSAASAGSTYRITATIYPASDAATSAATAFNDALKLARAPGSDRATNEKAAARFRDALGSWRQVGDHDMIAACLSHLAEVEAHQLFQTADAIPIATEAVGMYEELRGPTELVGALGTLAFSQIMTGQADAGLATLDRSYEHAADVDPLVRAEVEDDIVRATMDTGDLDRAATFGERSAATFRSAGARRDESYVLERLSLVYSRMGRFDDALRAINDAIGLGRQFGRDNDVATMTLSVGRIQMAAGDDEAALAAFRESLALFKGQAPNRIVARLSIGRIYDRRGDGAEARPVLEEALAEVPSQLRDLWAAVATELGTSLTLVGDTTRALDLQRKALEIVDAARSRVAQLTVLRDITRTYRARGDLAAAEAAIDRAREIGAQVPGDPYAAFVLRERASNARAAGDLPGARRLLDDALRIVESERGRLQSQALRASFGGTLQDYYQDAIAIELQMHAASPAAGHDARAFELFERSRARSLADLLSERKIDAIAGGDPALVGEQRSLQRQLASKDAALRDLAPKDRARSAALEAEIADIERRLAVVDGRIRSSNPRYAALAHPSPATLADAQRLLDAGTVLLALDIGRPSFGWAITTSSIVPFALPPAARIEERARLLYADLDARRRGARAGSRASAGGDLVRDAAALSDMVLGPIADRLAGEWRTRRLAVVATGPLEYVPFASLPLPHRAGEWLVDRHELVQLPSVSVLALLRGEPPRTSASGVVVLADPVYSADDPRVRAERERPIEHAIAASGDGDPLLRGVSDTRGGPGRLVFSRDEANAIAGLMPRRAVVEALDFAASVSTMSGPAVANARIVHIASHGLFNDSRPELSGLVLSLVDRQGRREPGVLHLYDVFNLKLSADLVVLSGCQTGLGRQLRGEGLMGLSRAFMYAGARHVIASLWAVDDLATAELMRRFYRALLIEKRPPANALVAAQRQLRRDPRWRSPFYWAGFTIVGDWR